MNRPAHMTMTESRWSRFLDWLRTLDDALDRQPYDHLHDHVLAVDRRVAKLEEEIRRLQQRL